MVSSTDNTLVLYVGDEGIGEELAAAIEAGDDVTLRTVERQTAALETLKTEHIDCLVDGCLAGEERFAFLSAVRGTDRSVPYLFITEEPALVDDALAAGATDVVVDTEPKCRQQVLGHRLTVLLYRDGRRERERQLEAERRATDQLLDAIDDIFYLIDEDGYLQEWNETLKRVTGYSDDEIAEMHALDFFPENDRNQVADAIGQALDTGSTTVEARLLTKEDGQIPVEFTGAQVVDDDDQPRGVVGIGRDITERKKRIRKLDQFRCHVSDVVWMSDPTKERMHFISDSYEDVWGLTPESLREDPVSFVDAIHPDDRERVQEALAAQQTNPDDYEETYRVVQPDGTVRWVHDRASGVYEDGQLIRIIGIASDITEQKRREQELELKNQAMDEAPIGITILHETDGECSLTYANDGLVQVTGYGSDAVVGETFDLFVGTDTDETRIAELRSAASQGKSLSVVTLLYRKDGIPFWARVTLAPVASSSGVTNHFVAFIQDVSEIKEHEQEIARRLNEFGDVLAEDLRVPLESAIEELRTARENGGDTDLEAAVQSLQRIDKLIDDLTTVHVSTVKSRESVAWSPLGDGGKT